MDIELINSNTNIASTSLPPSKFAPTIDTSIEFNSNVKNEDSQIQQNEAMGLMQLIISRLSGSVIRQISPSEYAHLLSIIDDIISGSVNKQI